MAIIAINGWNRLAVSFRAVVETYQPAVAAKAAESESGPKRMARKPNQAQLGAF